MFYTIYSGWWFGTMEFYDFPKKLGKNRWWTSVPNSRNQDPNRFHGAIWVPDFLWPKGRNLSLWRIVWSIYIYSYKYIYISTDYIYDVHTCFCIIYPLLICSMEQTHLKWGHPLFVDLPLGLSTGQKSMRRRIWWSLLTEYDIYDIYIYDIYI
jgi:hypothetical protein